MVQIARRLPNKTWLRGDHEADFLVTAIRRWQRRRAASYPDVSLSMKMCAQRKAGRRQRARRASPAVCTLPMVPCGSSPVTCVSRSPLRREKRSARGGSLIVRRPSSFAVPFASLRGKGKGKGNGPRTTSDVWQSGYWGGGWVKRRSKKRLHVRHTLSSLCRYCTTMTWKCLILRFMEEILSLEMGFKNPPPEEFQWIGKKKWISELE